MTTIEQIQIQWECQQLLNRVLLLMDSADWHLLVGCYANDGELARPTDPHNLIKGRDDILASFQKRPPKTTCHLLANSVFSVRDPEIVNATSRALLMSGPAASNDQYPVDAGPELLAGTFRDTLVKVNKQWLIKKRVGSLELKYSYTD